MFKAHVAPFVRYWKGIRQAESPEGGTLPKIRGPLVRLMRDSYIRYGDCVGTDARGKYRLIGIELCVLFKISHTLERILKKGIAMKNSLDS